MAEEDKAVVNALRTILAEAEAREAQFWRDTHIVNRWIDQPPGAWRGKWRRLRLSPDSGDQATRENLVTHVRLLGTTAVPRQLPKCALPKVPLVPRPKLTTLAAVTFACACCARP